MATDETKALVACGALPAAVACLVLSAEQVEPRTLQATLVAVFLLLTELNRRTKPWHRSLAPVAGRFWPLCAPTRRPLRRGHRCGALPRELWDVHRRRRLLLE